MGISRISDLFAANVDSVYGSNSAKKVSQQNQKSSQSSESSEAVTVDNKLVQQGGESVGAKEQRLLAIKAQVQNRNYSAPQGKVAEALFRDLF